MKFLMLLRRDFYPNSIMLSRQIYFAVRTNLSEYEFKHELLNGVFNGSGSELFMIFATVDEQYRIPNFAVISLELIRK
jgi:hypothetical protein